MLLTMQDETTGVTETLDRLQRTWTRLVMSGKPNGLAEKPDLLGSLEQIAGQFGQLRSELQARSSRRGSARLQSN